jgi:hypothetical protein
VSTVKRIAVIFLLCLLLFNWIGYQLYTAILQRSADKTLIADLDHHNYTDRDLISIKVPAVHLSSYVNSTEFVRVDGKVEIGGVQFNYVKRRYIQDSIELLCIPNQKSTRLQSAKDEFFKLVNDLQHPGQSKKTDQHSNTFKGFNADYYAESNRFTISDFTNITLKRADNYLLQISDVSLTPAGQPPDLA